MKNIVSREESNRIEKLCQEYKIYNYTINPDGSLDVDGNVSITRRISSAGKLSLRFRKVTKDFVCTHNGLTTLEGCPSEIGGNFSCGGNFLDSLDHAPKKVGGAFLCYDNKITSLIGAPKEIPSNFMCGKNKLSSLVGGPEKVMGTFSCNANELTTLEGAPSYVGNHFVCVDNKLTTLQYAPGEVHGDFKCGGNKLTALCHIPAKVKYIDFSYNKLGTEFDILYNRLDVYQRLTFAKYFVYYEVWIDDKYIPENMESLIHDIIVEGLR